MRSTAVVLSDLFRSCRGSLSCRSRFGDLRDQWLIAIARLDDRPLLEHVRHVGGGDVLIDGALFVKAVAAMLAEDLAVQQQLPAIIDGAAHRQISADIASAITDEGVVCVGYRYGCSARFSLGAYLNAFCADGEPVARSVEVDPLVAKIGVKRAFEADPYPRACSVWPMHEASSAPRPRRIETPILLVSGRVDPFTLASDVQHLAAQLPPRFSVIVQGQNHDVFGPNCAPAIRDAWIDDPSTQPPHRPCLAAPRSASV